MNLLLACLAAAVLGIETGWRPLSDGGMEYIIQLDEQTLAALRAGQAIQSDIPPEAGIVRSYRIVVGEGKLPRVESPQTARPHASDKPPQDVTPESPPMLDKPPSAALPKNADVFEVQQRKPWGLLMFALLGLFASLGTNVYLGWLVYGYRRRFFGSLRQ